MVRDGEGQAKGGITGFSGVPLHAAPPFPGAPLSGPGMSRAAGAVDGAEAAGRRA